MATNKIAITDRLRGNIIEIRKERGLSSYELSEKSGHSKFWLQNIESKKTQKISEDDLIAIYKILYDTDDDDEASYYIEKILNQQIGAKKKEWFDLINISDDFSEEYDMMTILNKMHSILSKDICEELMNAVYNMSINSAQAALTAVQSLSYSIYKNVDLALALINIPVYGVDSMNEQEHQTAINDLLSMGAKYTDLVEKNNSIEIIRQWKERDKQKAEENIRTLTSALNNYKTFLTAIAKLKNASSPSLFKILNQFNTYVSFAIERVCPGTLGRDINYHVNDGKGFATLIEECYDWFSDNESIYKLPNIESFIDSDTYTEARKYLQSASDELFIPPLEDYD